MGEEKSTHTAEKTEKVERPDGSERQESSTHEVSTSTPTEPATGRRETMVPEEK